MESVHQQFRQLKESYEHMTEDELGALAEQGYDLTDIAREALQAVITERGFTVRLKLKPPASLQAEPPEDDKGLIDFRWPDNADHAWRWMKVLTAAGIPSFLGPDKVMHLEEFQGKFDGPVSLKIRGVDLERTYAALERAYAAVERARARARANSGNEKAPKEEKDNVRNILSGISFPPVESVDQQFRQLKENYEHMTEGELFALAEKAYDLTQIACEALQAVIKEKNLDLRLTLDPLAPLRPEDEDLVIFRWEPNIQEAGWTMKALAADGIPSFLCLEIRAGDVKRAHAAFDRALDEIGEDDPEKDFAILCPKCRSAKAVLKGRTSAVEASPLGVKLQ